MNCHENERNSEETTTHNVTFNIRIFRLIDLRRVAYASNIPSNYSLLLSSQLFSSSFVLRQVQQTERVYFLSK